MFDLGLQWTVLEALIDRGIDHEIVSYKVLRKTEAREMLSWYEKVFWFRRRSKTWMPLSSVFSLHARWSIKIKDQRISINYVNKFFIQTQANDKNVCFWRCLLKRTWFSHWSGSRCMMFIWPACHGHLRQSWRYWGMEASQTYCTILLEWNPDRPQIYSYASVSMADAFRIMRTSVCNDIIWKVIVFNVMVLEFQKVLKLIPSIRVFLLCPLQR